MSSTISRQQPKDIPHWGVDRRAEDRPGIPMELEPHPVGGAHWREPERQQATMTVLKRADLAELTPVFGTAIAPRGLSGLIRRAAYGIPDHLARHWMLLLFADRVDVVENRLLRALRFWPIALPVLAAGMWIARPRRSRWRKGWI